MRQRSLFRALSILSLLALASSCATVGRAPRTKGPLVKACFVQKARGGIECALKTPVNGKSTVFLPWPQIQATFLSGFDNNVIVPREDFMMIIERMHQ